MLSEPYPRLRQRQPAHFVAFALSSLGSRNALLSIPTMVRFSPHGSPLKHATQRVECPSTYPLNSQISRALAGSLRGQLATDKAPRWPLEPQPRLPMFRHGSIRYLDKRSRPTAIHRPNSQFSPNAPCARHLAALQQFTVRRETEPHIRIEDSGNTPGKGHFDVDVIYPLCAGVAGIRRCRSRAFEPE
jgi:hypothetical protein